MPIYEGTGYDKVFLSGHGPDEGSSWLSKRESYAHSPNDEEENYDKEEVEDGEGEEEDQYL